MKEICKMCNLLLTLLDRIELEEDYTLASQRFKIVEDLECTIEIRVQTSGKKH